MAVGVYVLGVHVLGKPTIGGWGTMQGVNTLSGGHPEHIHALLCAHDTMAAHACAFMCQHHGYSYIVYMVHTCICRRQMADGTYNVYVCVCITQI